MKVATGRRVKAGRSTAAGQCFGLALVNLALTATLARSQPDPVITVRMYNYAQVPDETLARAEVEARRILNAAGVEPVWLACFELRGQSQEGANQDCARPFDGATVVLRILPGSPPGKAAVPDAAFGLALGNSVASIFYQRVRDLAHEFRRYDSDIPVILGNATARE